MTIICLAGKSRAGKDSAGNVLVKKHGFVRIALADSLRELCSKVFRIDYNEFLDQDKKDSPMPRIMLDYHHIDEIRHHIESNWGISIDHDTRENMEEYYGAEFNTPREILRIVGTSLIRNLVRDDIWILLAMEKLKKLGGNIVITDCRFQNERDYFGAAGALICLIQRNDDGETRQHEFDLGSPDEYDVVFQNNGTLNEFQSSIDMYYTIMREELTNYRIFKYE